jgi:hypothetical protein
VYSLVLASLKIPMGVIPKRFSMGKPWCFGVSEIGKTKGRSSRTRKSRNPELQNLEIV